MDWQTPFCIVAAALAVSLTATPVAAQSDDSGGQTADETSAEQSEQTDESDTENDDTAASDSEDEDAAESDNQDEDAAESDDQDEDAAESDDQDDDPDTEEADSGDQENGSEEARESAHGEYEWKPSYGGGLEYGLFFSDLGRWNSNLMGPNDAPAFDIGSVSSFNFALEASFLEGSRLTLFAGLDTPFSSNPGLTAVYGGLEPAFAFRRDQWEMALGFGVGLGSVNLSTDAGSEFSAGLVTLRPTFEVRRYIDEFAAGYLRFGFNQWLPFNADSDDFEIQRPDERPTQVGEENLLNEGGVYAALGFRFGHYPKHVKSIPDSDGDGLRDDVDDCAQKPEDEDGFQDNDGCPDPDNDGDGIEDDNDECPGKAEDKDGFEDEDGCPEPDNDGDGIDDEDDKCPDEAEDFDEYNDEDGCADPDNDGDGIEDGNDDCTNEAGIPSENGCPSTKVSIEGDRLVLDGSIEFESEEDNQPASSLTEDSGKLLDELAEVLELRSELSEVEIRAYPGSDVQDAQKLADTRAQAVGDYLADAGIDDARLTTSGVTDAGEFDGEKAGVTFQIVERSEMDGGDSEQDTSDEK
jgi:outer membrane protein OmpA-like peptidoglycan-associated protein